MVEIGGSAAIDAQNKNKLFEVRLPVAQNEEQKDTYGNRCNNILCNISYDLGGMNYMQGRPKPRGFYLSVHPTEYKKFSGGSSDRSGILQGGYALICEASRFSQKAALAAIEQGQDMLPHWVEEVCTQEGIELPDTAKNLLQSALQQMDGGKVTPEKMAAAVEAKAVEAVEKNTKTEAQDRASGEER